MKLKFFSSLVLSLLASLTFADEPIFDMFVEDFGGPKPGFRYKVRNLQIEGGGNIFQTPIGGAFEIEMEVLHDCRSCGNAINQIIVGLSSDEKAQISVWNGKQRSGGPLKFVNPGTSVQCLAEDNEKEAEWVKVYFSLNVPNQDGIYYIRTRYSQAYTGNLMTDQAKHIKQPKYKEPLGWWKVNRPSTSSNIGKIVVSKSNNALQKSSTEKGQ